MKRTKAQSVSEYSICIVVILLTLIAIQMYVKRGLQGRYFDLATYTTSRLARDGQVLDVRDVGSYYLDEDFTGSQDIDMRLTKQPRGVERRDIFNDEIRRRGTSTEGINAYE